MHAVEQKILQCFARQPYKDLSTTDLVKEVFLQDYEEIKNFIHNEQQDADVRKLGKRKKARLHRKLLYYLNKLSGENVIKLTRVESRGEKYFVLNAKNFSSSKREDKIIGLLGSVSNLEEPKMVLSGLETYEERNLVKKFDSRDWFSKINAFLLETNCRKDLSELYLLIQKLYLNFNDVIALNDFSYAIDYESLPALSSFIRKINMDTKDYNKYINILINLSKVKDSVKLTDFIVAYSQINPEKVFIIFTVNSKTISNHTRFMKILIKNFSSNKIRINLHNEDLKKAPLMIGRAGAYTFDDSDWQNYLDNTKGKTIGLCSSETSVYIDVYRFFKQGGTFSEFREFLLKAAKAFLVATTSLRKKSDIYFKNLNELNGDYQNKFFSTSFNYIRLWNYSPEIFSLGEINSSQLKENILNFEALLKSCVEEINEFCKIEETIYKSCGIPIRFKIVLSSAFKRFDKDFLSKRIYSKVTIKGLKDFGTDELLEYIRQREIFFKIFVGGDRARFFRAVNFTPEETLAEFKYILENFKLPLFTYDFNSRKGEVTLDNFFD